MNQINYQPVSQVTTVPVQFSYSQVSQNRPVSYTNVPHNINTQPNFYQPPSMNVGIDPAYKTNSHIIYKN